MRQRDHLRELDGLRGCAVLGVLLAHLDVGNLLYIPVGMAHHGVDLFFVLSGFLITRIRVFEQERGIGLKQFWIKRVTRIFPAAYLCLLIVGLCWGFGPHLLMAGLYLTTFDVGLYSGDVHLPIGHFWTLAVEEQFYLMWPLVLLFPLSVAKRVIQGLWLFAIGAFSGLGVYCSIHCPDGPVWNMLNSQLLTRGWPLMVGSLLAIYEIRIRHRPGILLWLSGMSVAVGIAFRGFLFLHMLHGGCNVQQFRLMGGQFLALAIFSTVLYLSYRGIPNPFQSRLLSWIGAISYGLYLYHLPIYQSLDVIHYKGLWPLAVGGSFLAATLSYYLYERPLIRWGRERALSLRLSELLPASEDDELSMQAKEL